MSATYERIDGENDNGAVTKSSFFAYVVSCPLDRRCQVGMGIVAFSERLDEKLEFSGELEKDDCFSPRVGGRLQTPASDGLEADQSIVRIGKHKAGPRDCQLVAVMESFS